MGLLERQIKPGLDCVFGPQGRSLSKDLLKPTRVY